MHEELLSFTQQQLSCLRSVLLHFSRKQRDRGMALLQQGAVVDARWVVPDKVLEATVLGAHGCLASLTFGKASVEPDCTCPRPIYCQHAAALVCQAVQHGIVRADAENSRGNAAEATESGSLRQFVRERVGKTLSQSVVKLLTAADAWWNAGRSQVDADEFFAAFGRPYYWGHYLDTVTLYPAEFAPSNAAEFLAWLYLASEKRQVTMPPAVFSAVDSEMLRRLRTAQAQLEQVRTWKHSLAQWARPRMRDAAVPELRLKLGDSEVTLEMRVDPSAEFVKASRAVVEHAIRTLSKADASAPPWGTTLVLGVALDAYGTFRGLRIPAHEPALVRSLAALFEAGPAFAGHLVAAHGGPPEWVTEPLRWHLEEPGENDDDNYRLRLADAAGRPAPPALAVVPGKPLRYVTAEKIYPLESWPAGNGAVQLPAVIPAAAVESAEGLAALRQLGLPVPKRLAGRVRVLQRKVEVTARLVRPQGASSDYLRLRAKAVPAARGRGALGWDGHAWEEDHARQQASESANDELIDVDDSILAPTTGWLQSLPLRPANDGSKAIWLEQRVAGKDWARNFAAWFERRPAGCNVRLEGELASLADGRVAGRVHLDVEESSGHIDWFDLRVALEVTDTELTQKEIALLLKAAGDWVRLDGKGWRRLDFAVSEEEERELATLGLSVQDFGAERQRLHVLQLGALAGNESRLLPDNRVAQVRRRLEEIKTRVAPPAPRSITAKSRPYQIEGFHFLAYLTENNFGGVLADDMGLGKTLQALLWLAWLRESGRLDKPALVICPKSVQDNWRGEAAKFYPDLRVEVWTRASAGKSGLDGAADLLVIHYAQLRNHAALLQGRTWGAVIIDEAQAIKNPTSQNARTACALTAAHRLALTGTPIENRLTDLWSIFAFAMPGVLGNRASFTRQFERRDDPLARRRLAARTRPFLLRRTKNEVARDLPERVEEDLFVEMEGKQAELYRAELKRARAQLLNVRTPKQLDKLRFNILTSLLRLRQICCHPRLVGFEDTAEHKSTDGGAASAKVAALLETLEPLMEEGQKVLVFSQFVQMLSLLEEEVVARSWARFTLTGDTEDRGALVEEFDRHEGAAVFFISLKAGGTGLNLAAASYVVLFDPWWNPAVEAQAIDRTHRIGQKKTVFAYRLLVKNTIEEKIRDLQRRKGQLARDILGEENFAQALTLDDFRFLLGDDDEERAAPAITAKTTGRGK